MRRACVVVAVLALLTACWAEVPEANSPAVEDERRAALASAEAVGADVIDDREVLATARRDVCRTGQQNSKVDESAFACVVAYGWVLSGAAEESGVAAELARMSDLLSGRGCEPIREGGLATAERYWREDVQADPGQLPSANFRCGEATVEVDPVSPSTPRVPPIALQDVLNGDDVAEPTLEEYPADVESRIEAAGAMSWNVVVTQVYARTD